jgi:hypothetical protein
MLRAVEGLFRDGRVELQEIPENIQIARVIVTFLAEAEPKATPSGEAAERVRGFEALVASLPDAPAPPLASLDRADLYP